MGSLLDTDYFLLWAFILGIALFFPVRNLIWIQYVRRAQRQDEVNNAEKQRLKKRAGITSALICFVFSILYTSYLFSR